MNLETLHPEVISLLECIGSIVSHHYSLSLDDLTGCNRRFHWSKRCRSYRRPRDLQDLCALWNSTAAESPGEGNWSLGTIDTRRGLWRLEPRFLDGFWPCFSHNRVTFFWNIQFNTIIQVELPVEFSQNVTLYAGYAQANNGYELMNQWT